MAKNRHEHTTGRMLFTDFDASVKGRPVATFESATLSPGPGAPASHLPALSPAIPSIEEFASSLDFDFEDDGDTPAPEKKSAAGIAAISEDDKPKPESVAAASFPSRPNPEPLLNTPTWEEYTKAFRQTGARAEARLDMPNNAQTDTHASVYANEPIQAAAAVPSPPTPEAATEQEMMDVDEEADFDILSALPPGIPVGEEHPDNKPFEGEWRGKRLGVEPPPPMPYGGIQRLDEWYRPPEANPVEEYPQPKENWSEPPEMDRPQRRSSPTTRSVDIFSDMALDALWEEKLKQGRGRTNQTGRVSNFALDMFDALDLDAIWEKKQLQMQTNRSSAVATPDQTTANDAIHGATPDSTVILNRKDFDKDATVIMEPQQAIRVISGNEREGEQSPNQQSRLRKKRRKKPSPQPQEGAFAFIEDEDEEETAEPDPAATASADTDGRKKAQDPSTLDELDISHLIADEDLWPADNASVPVPIVGDDDIQPKGGKRKRSEISRNGESVSGGGEQLSLVKGSGEEDGQSAAPPRGHAGNLPEGDADVFALTAENAGHHDDGGLASPASPGQEAESPFGETDPEYDDYMPAVNADVAAPVIVDGDIQSRPRTKLKEEDGGEQEALVEDAGAAAINEDGTTLPGGEDEAQAPEAAAVDPMDVFSNIEAMDFSDDGLDDDMKAMLSEDGQEAESSAEATEDAATPAPEPPPVGWKAKIRFYARKLRTGEGLRELFQMIVRMVAWRENWWFYCDLLAALITSASLAVIISYFLWYRQ